MAPLFFCVSYKLTLIEAFSIHHAEFTIIFSICSRPLPCEPCAEAGGGERRENRIVDGLRRLAGGEAESDEAVADAIAILIHEEDIEFGGFFKRRNLQFQHHVSVGGDVHVADGETVHVPPVVGRLPGGALFGRWQRHIGDFLFGCETEDNVVQLIGYVSFDMRVIAIEAEIKPQVIDVVRCFEGVFAVLPNAWTPREIVCETGVFAPFAVWPSPKRLCP